MPKVEINREKIVEVLKSRKPVSLTEIYRHLGGKGKLSGSIAGRIRDAFGGVEKVVAQNKAATTLKTKPRAKQAQKVPQPLKYPRHPMNPFREGSNYSLAFDVLASSKDGLPLAEWRERYAKAARKPLKLACFDTQVLLTAKDTPMGERHKSCRDGFFIERQCDHVRIRFD